MVMVQCLLAVVKNGMPGRQRPGLLTGATTPPPPLHLHTLREVSRTDTAKHTWSECRKGSSVFLCCHGDDGQGCCTLGSLEGVEDALSLSHGSLCGVS